MKPHTVALILFLEGLASSGVQMLMIRQVTGHVGSSVLVTSIVISIFLAALALGYFYGGRASVATYRTTLVRNLALSIGLFGVGLSYPVFASSFVVLAEATANFPLVSHPLFHLFLYGIVVLAPLVFCLGQTVPLLLNTAEAETRTSEAAGNLTALSTVGNVAGALLTALIMLVIFGVGTSILLNCLVLFAALLLCLDWHVPSQKVSAAFATVFLGVTALLNTLVERDLFDATTEYANISVEDFGDGRAMWVNGQRASYFDDKGQAWPYIETMRSALRQRPPSEVLVLGAGGFTLSADQTLDLHSFTYVDIDRKLKGIAEDKLLRQAIKGQYVTDDARGFLLTRRDRWDVIVVDLFTSSIMVPSHTATVEFFELVRSRLKPGGMVMMNIVADPMFQDAYSIRIDRTVREAFGLCVTDLDSFREGLANLVYFCQGTAATGSMADMEPYRDGMNQVSIDGYLLANKRSEDHE